MHGEVFVVFACSLFMGVCRCVYAGCGCWLLATQLHSSVRPPWRPELRACESNVCVCVRVRVCWLCGCVCLCMLACWWSAVCLSLADCLGSVRSLCGKTSRCSRCTLQEQTHQMQSHEHKHTHTHICRHAAHTRRTHAYGDSPHEAPMLAHMIRGTATPLVLP